MQYAAISAIGAGMPVAVEHYNIYKMIVRNPDKSELAHYYLNSFPQT